MSLSLHWVLRASLSLLIIHCGESSVMTEVQPGPLYRVIDYPLSLSCNVSGFVQVDRKKDFEFRMIRPDQPSQEINIISTKDKGFSFAHHSSRVRNKEIGVEYMSPNSVVLTIKKLIETDEGEYDCSVVNHEATYLGTYNAKTSVHVIDNSLSISSPDPASLSHDEGDSLVLTCQASSNTVQHTHLSITWYLHKDEEGQSHPIVSLNRDFTVSPGPAFEERFQAGLIGLDKVGETTYRLKLDQLVLSDQGRIFCKVQEWIQDPDRSWFSLAQMETKPTILNVTAKELPDKGSVVVHISVQNPTLQEGQELSVSCDVDAQNLAERFFSVAWLRAGVELARIGPTGVLSMGSEYSRRESEGELRVARISEWRHRLILRPIRTQDQGEYLCRVWPQDRGTDGAFTLGAAQDSRRQTVTISATEGGLSVKMEETLTVKEGENLQITCKVNGDSGQLSVTWRHRSHSATSSFNNIVTLSPEGVMEIGTGFGQRGVRAMRPAVDTFTLELDGATPADAGIYQCTVYVNTNDKIQKTYSHSTDSTVEVHPVESLIQVDLKSRNTLVTVGENAELICRVRGSHLPVTVKWNFQREGAATQDNILTLSPSGVISWRGESRRYQMKATTSSSSQVQNYFLLINGASIRDTGHYQCEVSVFLKNSLKRLNLSNMLGLVVKNPVSDLSLASSPSVEENINAEIAINCSVIKQTPFSRFAVTWLVQRESDSQTIIVASNRDAVVTFGPGVESSNGQRISMTRTNSQNFELNVRQARTEDSGKYYCKVVEWLQDPHGEWYELPPVNTTTTLKIIEPANDLRFNKMAHQLIATEGEELDLNCTLTSGASNPSFLYALTWFYKGHVSNSSKVPLVTLDYSGLLTYSDLQGRFRLSRPVPNRFHLRIREVHEGDSGTYHCHVKQFELNHQGVWKQKASDDSGSITLTVKPTKSILSVEKIDVVLNVTGSQEFSVLCTITAWSSKWSAFQVTWFRRRETEDKPFPIFTAYHDSTLQESSGRREMLWFGHPSTGNYNVTVFNSVAADSGVYSCEVEEWLLSPSKEWKKVAVEKSGQMTVNVYTEAGHIDERSGSGCPSHIILGVLICVIICLMVVLFLLAGKICRGQTSGTKTPASSLWAEELPLQSKPCLDD